MTTIANQLFASVLIEAAKKAVADEGDTAALEAMEAAQSVLYAVEREVHAERCEQCGGILYGDGQQPCDTCLFCGPQGPSEEEIYETEKKR
jgi:hypothetical protein